MTWKVKFHRLSTKCKQCSQDDSDSLVALAFIVDIHVWWFSVCEWSVCCLIKRGVNHLLKISRTNALGPPILRSCIMQKLSFVQLRVHMRTSIEQQGVDQNKSHNNCSRLYFKQFRTIGLKISTNKELSSLPKKRTTNCM